MNIKINGQNNVFQGSIGPFSSDNLGAHSVGGYIESFSSLRVCRICMGTGDDIQTKASALYMYSRSSHKRTPSLSRKSVRN